MILLSESGVALVKRTWDLGDRRDSAVTSGRCYRDRKFVEII